MAFDSLKKAVADYGDKMSRLFQEVSEYEEQQTSLDEIHSMTKDADDEIRQGMEGLQYSFDVKRSELKEREEALDSERESITDQIQEERGKLETVKQKLAGLMGKRYADGARKASEQCDALLSQLDTMMEEVGGTFGSFDIAPLRNGSNYFVQGSNYERFIQDYYSSEDSEYERLGDQAFITTISPDTIEGIHLGKTEAEDDTIFWSQHEKGGTRRSFVEIAKKIPEVKSRLEAGESLSDIRQDPRLAQCAGIYFEPSNIPRVIKNDGYYEFDSNGRHRILAAREAGQDIPVQVIGIRRRK